MTYCEEVKFSKTIKDGLYILNDKNFYYRIMQNKQGLQKFMYSADNKEWITIAIEKSLNDKLFLMFSKMRKEISKKN